MSSKQTNNSDNKSSKKKKGSPNKSFKKKGSSNKSFKKKGSPNNSKQVQRDQKFYDELHAASDIFFKECIVSQDKADQIRTRVQYEISFNGHNIWFNVGASKERDRIVVNKDSEYEFLRSKFFKNHNFQKRVYDHYLSFLPEIETKFIGPIRATGDLLIKLVPYHE